jgi:hypothetical protein
MDLTAITVVHGKLKRPRWLSKELWTFSKPIWRELGRLEKPQSLFARSKQVALSPKQPCQSNGNQCHAANRPPKSGMAVQQRNDIKVHAKNSGNQIQGQENGGDGSERSHGLAGAIALGIEVNLDRRFDALL